uniref:Uncharacterized protein n=1 Tax=Caenorhabditis japonica TaxID=281687 RepID=A0A8R1IGG3_CAEJA
MVCPFVINLFKKSSIEPFCNMFFPGPQERDSALDYIRKRFVALNKNKKRSIYEHVTCATDTQQIQVVIDSVIDVVIQHTMQKVGIQ